MLRLPEHALSPIVHTIPLQLLAYHTAVIRGTDRQAAQSGEIRHRRVMNAHCLTRRWALLSATAMLAGLALPARAQNQAVDPAVSSIRAFYDALLETMKQADKLGVRGRYAKLAPVIRSTYDLAAMTRIAIGADWNTIPPEQQTALLDGFARRTIATYANRFDGYSGQSFDVDPAVESRNTGRIVRTKLIRPPEIPVTLNYLMRGSGDT